MLPISGWFRQGKAIFFTAAVVAVPTLWYFTTRLPPLPQRPLRIGFEHNPPVQIRTDNGFTGLAVETVNEAAKRAGVRLKWVETGTSSDEAFQKGLVDLWPLMVNLPYRRKYVHFAPPYMHSSHVVVHLDRIPVIGRDFRVSRQRGELVESPLARYLLATVHPSSILRQRDDASREAEYAAFVEDLRVVPPLLDGA